MQGGFNRLGQHFILIHHNKNYITLDFCQGFSYKYKYYVKESTQLMLSDKKAAKKIIKLAKCCPEYYTSEEVIYAKIYKKSLKNEKRLTQNQSK